METRAHHLLIGIFTATVLVALVVFGLWLGQGGFARESDYYDIVFNEEVTGLSTGSSVLYNGIRVGEVSDLALDPADPRQVVARIRVSHTTPVKEDTHAQLGVLSFIAGTAHIQLSGGSPGSPPLLVDSDTVPVIMAEPSSIARLRAEGDILIAGINELIIKGNELLSPDNIERFGQALAHIEQISGVIAGQEEQIRDGLQAMVSVAQRSDEALARSTVVIDRAGEVLGRADRLLDEHGTEILADAARAMASLERATAGLDRLLLENEDALEEALQGMNEVGPAIHDLRRTLRSLGQVIRRLDEDPSGFFIGRDSVREVTP